MKRISLTMVLAILLFARAGKGAEAVPENVGAVLGLLDAFEHGGRVYLCSIVQRQKYQDSDGSVERGLITLKVIKTVHGSEARAVALPYACQAEGPMLEPWIWPRLANVGNRNLLCVVVPRIEDPSTPKYPGINEAASRVTVVHCETSPEVLEMERICGLYASRYKSDFAGRLMNSVTNSGPVER